MSQKTFAKRHVPTPWKFNIASEEGDDWKTTLSFWEGDLNVKLRRCICPLGVTRLPHWMKKPSELYTTHPSWSRGVTRNRASTYGYVVAWYYCRSFKFMCRKPTEIANRIHLDAVSLKPLRLWTDRWKLPRCCWSIRPGMAQANHGSFLGSKKKNVDPFWGAWFMKIWQILWERPLYPQPHFNLLGF